MLIIEVKDGETIDKAVKRLTKKFKKVGLHKELRKRQHYTKPSVKRRTEVLKAAYIKKKYSDVE